MAPGAPAGREERPVGTGSEPGEWVEWHRQYDEGPMLRERLKVVQQAVRSALAEAPPGPVRVVSACAGDGRDLLGVLPDVPRRGDVRARLIELDPVLAERGRTTAAGAHLAGVDVRTGDASLTSSYAGAVPADLLLFCGVFGNVTDADVRTTIVHLPELCAPRATVIWTRGRFAPDLTPTIRGWFSDAGFEERGFVTIPGTTASVGVHRLRIPPRPYDPAVRLFTFLPPDERPSRRAGGAAVGTSARAPPPPTEGAPDPGRGDPPSLALPRHVVGRV